MEEYIHSTFCEIDLKQLKKNIALIKKATKKGICFPIKADAYGHGLFEVAKVVEKLVDYFGIAHIAEGIEIRKKGINKPILLFNPFFEKDVDLLIKYDIEPALSSFQDLFLIKDKKMKVHLKIDTGMSRCGIDHLSAKDFFQDVKKNKGLKIKSIYSHLSCSEDILNQENDNQISRFLSFLDSIDKEDMLYHMCNSGGVINYKKAYFDLVRPGLLAYGYLPCDSNNRYLKEIKPIFSLKSRICLVKDVKKGSGVSYNRDFVAKEDLKVAIIPIGYGDGYRFNLSNEADVLIKGKRCRILGRICMDLLMADISEIDAKKGDEVVLIGRQKTEEITAKELSEILNTNIYEITCGITKRVKRKYLS